jgi:hypothetical protein
MINKKNGIYIQLNNRSGKITRLGRCFQYKVKMVTRKKAVDKLYTAFDIILVIAYTAKNCTIINILSSLEYVNMLSPFQFKR